MDELRAAWGVPAGAPLLAIGQLSPPMNPGRSFWRLENLESPMQGHGLVYPTQKAAATAYVSPREADRASREQELSQASDWMIAELILSRAEERLKHNNPHGCMARPGSLRLLKDLPPEWNAAVIGGQSVRLLTESARVGLEDHVRAELLRTSEELSARLREDRAEAMRIDEAMQEARERHAEQSAALEARTREDRARFDAEIAQAKDAFAAAQADLRNLEDLLINTNDMISQGNLIMAERFRKLSDLLAQKGERLVALGLVDEDDLRGLLLAPSETASPAEGDLSELLEGRFDRLAPFLQARLWRRGMLFPQAMLRDFLALIRTHDLVVLAGDSGSGKTSLVRAVAGAIGARCAIIPVKPNWTGPEDLLGYYNPIERSYRPTPFLQALQAAEREPDILHFICLDEMNLARVEYYFADFLSLLEARGEQPLIPLYASEDERHTVMENDLFLSLEAEARQRAGLPADATLEDLLKNDVANRALHQLGGFQDAESVLLHHGRLRRALAASLKTPTSLRFPANLRIFGAINVDETTHYLSPKVLDRVHVLRFRNPVLNDWDALEAEIEGFDDEALSRPLRISPQELGARGDYPAFDRKLPAAAFLTQLARDHLDPLGVEFGLRAIRQSLGYLQAAEIAGMDEATALNNVILHKVLPKLTLDTERNGPDGRKRREILIGLRDYLSENLDQTALAPNVEDCVVMLDRLIDSAQGNNGVANYWLR